MSEQVAFESWAIGVARSLSELLQTVENNGVRALSEGDCPYSLPDGVRFTEVIAAALLMVLCGMLADEDGGGKDILMSAADRLRAIGIPGAEEIREAADGVLDTMGAVRTKHRWN